MVSKYGSQVCNFCVNEAIYFVVVGGASSRRKVQQMVLELDHQMLLTG